MAQSKYNHNHDHNHSHHELNLQNLDQDHSAKISYILNLLGKPSLLSTPPQDDNDSDYEDIMTDEEEDIYTFDSKQQLVQDLYNPHSPFNPTLSPHDFNPDQPQLTAGTNSDNEKSSTILQQQQVELVILEAFRSHPHLNFLTDHHINYINRSLYTPLPHYFNALDANHTWMVYWLINAHKLIKSDHNHDGSLINTMSLINDKIETCIIKDGKLGIAGGSNQIGHIASTFSAILSLILTRNYTRLSEIRSHLYDWFLSLKQADGSFLMHRNGESDSRSVYCVLAIATLLNINTQALESGILDWINSNQSYEGGFSNNVHNECHGGYSFCSLSIYYLLFNHKKDFTDDSKSNINLDNLIRWLVMRQFNLEGGLNGRTNKLVDACYGYWIGAIYPMIEVIINQPIFDRNGLKAYLLKAGQNFDKGGFRDKPGKSTDFYHTNYAISGLSICEYNYELREGEDEEDDDEEEVLAFKLQACNDGDNDKDAKFTNPIHPVFGIPINDVNDVRQYFKNFPKPI